MLFPTFCFRISGNKIPLFNLKLTIDMKKRRSNASIGIFHAYHKSNPILATNRHDLENWSHRIRRNHSDTVFKIHLPHICSLYSFSFFDYNAGRYSSNARKIMKTRKTNWWVCLFEPAMLASHKSRCKHHKISHPIRE